MNTTERAGVDVQVALSASARRLSREGPEVPAPHDEAVSDDPTRHAAQGALTPATPPTGRPRPASVVKRAARPLVAAVFRGLKPLLRPLAFRVRAYLTEPILVELRRQSSAQEEAFRRAAERQEADVVRLARHLDASIARQASRIESSTDRLVADRAMQTMQEVQASRDLLARRISQLAPDMASAELAPLLARIEQYSMAAARRTAIYCGEGVVLVRTNVGYVLCHGTDQALVSTLVEAGELEPGTRALIQRLLRPGDTFVDVGANVGMHTLAAAAAMAGQGRIVAFEPFPATHALLARTIWLNGFSGITQTHQAAASNRRANRPLFLGATPAHHSLYQLQDPMAPAAPQVEVELVRIDDVLQGDSRVDLIKIDVEGAELDVLDGARATISNNPNVGMIVEFGFSHLERTGHTTQDWLQSFQRIGLAYGAIDPESGELEALSVDQLEATPSVNLFLARPESEIWSRAWKKS